MGPTQALYGVGAVLALMASPAFAAANLVVNGSFEQTVGTLSSNGASISGQITTTDLPGWTVASTYPDLDVLFTPGSADTTGAPGGANGTVRLWGPNGTTGNVSNNGLPATSGDGGNFIAVDGDHTYGTAVQQTVGGLSAGTNYLLTFLFAGAQEAGNSGATTEAWAVSFGAQTLSSAVLATPNHGFSGWQTASLLFTAGSASQLLSFLAVGTPGGQPPIALLDGVTLVAAPEPASWAMMAVGLAGLCGLVRWRAGPSRFMA